MKRKQRRGEVYHPDVHGPLTDDRCPKCNGASGVTFRMTETHIMFAPWGNQATAEGGSGRNVKIGLAECADCGARFSVKALERKGLLK
jgi:transcription elongation factor Elf1